MGDSLRYKDWFEKAAHDLRGAEILMEHDGGNDLVAFHCQQTMEKMLKGWLLKTGAPLKGNLRDCAYVNQFYIETRYPSDSYMLYACVRRGSTGLHGCRKEIDGTVGITLRLLFDYYREKPRKPCPARLLRFFLQNAKNLCDHDQTTAPQRFPA